MDDLNIDPINDDKSTEYLNPKNPKLFIIEKGKITKEYPIKYLSHVRIVDAEMYVPDGNGGWINNFGRITKVDEPNENGNISFLADGRWGWIYDESISKYRSQESFIRIKKEKNSPPIMIHYENDLPIRYNGEKHLFHHIGTNHPSEKLKCNMTNKHLEVNLHSVINGWVTTKKFPEFDKFKNAGFDIDYNELEESNWKSKESKIKEKNKLHFVRIPGHIFLVCNGYIIDNGGLKGSPWKERLTQDFGLEYIDMSEKINPSMDCINQALKVKSLKNVIDNGYCVPTAMAIAIRLMKEGHLNGIKEFCDGIGKEQISSYQEILDYIIDNEKFRDFLIKNEVFDIKYRDMNNFKEREKSAERLLAEKEAALKMAEENKNLKIKNKELEEEFRKIRSAQNNISVINNKNIDSLNSRLEEKDREIKRLKAELDLQLKEKGVEVIIKNEEISRKNQEIERLNQVLSKLRDKDAKKLAELLVKKEQELKDMTKKADLLSKDLKYEESQTNYLNAVIREKKNDIKSLEEEVKNLKSSLDAKDKQISKLEKDMKDLKNQHEKTVSDLEKKMKNQKDQYDKEVVTLNKAMSDLKNQHEKTIVTLNTEIKNLKNQYESTTFDLEKTKKNFDRREYLFNITLENLDIAKELEFNLENIPVKDYYNNKLWNDKADLKKIRTLIFKLNDKEVEEKIEYNHKLRNEKGSNINVTGNRIIKFHKDNPNWDEVPNKTDPIVYKTGTQLGDMGEGKKPTFVPRGRVFNSKFVHPKIPVDLSTNEIKIRVFEDSNDGSSKLSKAKFAHDLLRSKKEKNTGTRISLREATSDSSENDQGR